MGKNALPPNFTGTLNQKEKGKKNSLMDYLSLQAPNSNYLFFIMQVHS